MQLPAWTKVPQRNGVGLQFSVATGEVVVPGRDAISATSPSAPTRICSLILMIKKLMIKNQCKLRKDKVATFLFREAQPYPLCPSSEEFNKKDPPSALRSWHRSIDKIMSDATFTTDVMR